MAGPVPVVERVSVVGPVPVVGRLSVVELVETPAAGVDEQAGGFDRLNHRAAWAGQRADATRSQEPER